MPILYSVVARGTTVLAMHATCMGNFAEVVQNLLPTLTPENGKETFAHSGSNFMFHYIKENRIIYMCIADDDFERSKAFAFLTEVKRKFTTQYGVRVETALPYSMNSAFSPVLEADMRHFNSERNFHGGNDKLHRTQNQVDELKDIMVRNIDHLAARGERLELLVDKTEDLNASSVSFKKASTNLQRSLWWKNVKLTVGLVIAFIVILYIIVSISCGGLAWQKCVGKS